MFSNDFRISSLKYKDNVQRGYKMSKDPNQNNNTSANKEKEDERSVSEKTRKKMNIDESGSFDFYV